VVRAAVPPEPEALMADGPPETAPNGAAVSPKAKATAGERSSTSRLQVGGSQEYKLKVTPLKVTPAQRAAIEEAIHIILFIRSTCLRL